MAACALVPQRHVSPSKQFKAIYDALHRLSDHRHCGDGWYPSPMHLEREELHQPGSLACLKRMQEWPGLEWPGPECDAILAAIRNNTEANWLEHAPDKLDCFSWQALKDPDAALNMAKQGGHPAKDPNREPADIDHTDTRLSWFRWYTHVARIGSPRYQSKWVAFEDHPDSRKAPVPPMPSGQCDDWPDFGVAWGHYWHPNAKADFLETAERLQKPYAKHEEMLNGRRPRRMVAVVRDKMRQKDRVVHNEYTLSELAVALEYVNFMGASDGCAVLLLTIFGDEDVRITEARWEEGRTNEEESKLVFNLLPMVNMASKKPSDEALRALAWLDPVPKEYVRPSPISIRTARGQESSKAGASADEQKKKQSAGKAK